MVDRLVVKGAAKDRCVLFPNWVDIDAIRPIDHDNPLRRELQLPEAVSYTHLYCFQSNSISKYVQTYYLYI